MQIGSGNDFLGNADAKSVTIRNDFYIASFRYKKSLNEDFKNASLIISHAGAGTITECLELKKNIIVVCFYLIII